MAGNFGGERPARQQAQASRDAYSAGRDVIIHQPVPLVPSSEATPPERVWVNIPARNPGFTGRDGLLSAMRDALAADDRAVVQVLHGMGGVGKTQLTAEYAHRFAWDYDVVLWVNAENASLIAGQFAALGARLGCVALGADVAVMRGAVLGELRQRRRWLLVFDNAQGPEDIAGWLPGGGGHALITSRSRGWDELAVPVEVDVLARSESMAILRDRVHGLAEADACRVAEALGDLPLAVAQAAGYMAETGMPAGEYAALLTVRAAELLDQGRPASYRLSLAAVTELALERLRAADPAAAQVAGICAALAPEPVPAQWFVAAAGELPAPLGERASDPLAWRRVLATIARSAVARIDGGGLVMHRLTQAIIRGQVPAGRDATVALAGKVLAANRPGDRDLPANWPHWARLLPHLLAVEPASTSDASVRRLASEAAWYLARRGDAQASHDLARRLYDQWRSSLGPDHEDTLAAAMALGGALRGLGHFDQAREIDQDTLARCLRMLGEDHPEALWAASNLAGDLRNLGEFAAARELDEDVLVRRRRVLGEDHPHTLTSANNLADDLRMLGEFAAARELNEDTLVRRRRVLGEDHPSTLRSAGNLVGDLDELGEHEPARVLGEEVLARRRAILGEHHPETLASARQLDRLLAVMGDPAAVSELRDRPGDTTAGRTGGRWP
jgi:hypothetical protein